MKVQTKAFIYNLLGFALIFLLVRFVLAYFFHLNRWVLALVAAIVASLLAPKFGVVKTANGDKLFVKWIFKKGVKEV